MYNQIDRWTILPPILLEMHTHSDTYRPVDYFSFSLISYEGQQMIVKVFSDVHK